MEKNPVIPVDDKNARVEHTNYTTISIREDDVELVFGLLSIDSKSVNVHSRIFMSFNHLIKVNNIIEGILSRSVELSKDAKKTE